MPHRPAFSDLPLNKGDPWLSAWGLWGPNDELGTLNFLTHDVVKAATAEIKDGVRISLNWTFGQPSRPCFNRQICQHKVISLGCSSIDESRFSGKQIVASLMTF